MNAYDILNAWFYFVMPPTFEVLYGKQAYSFVKVCLCRTNKFWHTVIISQFWYQLKYFAQSNSNLTRLFSRTEPKICILASSPSSKMFFTLTLAKIVPQREKFFVTYQVSKVYQADGSLHFHSVVRKASISQFHTVSHKNSVPVGHH